MASIPDSAASVGESVCQFAADAGLVLDGWQQDVVNGAMGLRPAGTWAARHVGLLVPRQNGKGSILEARELYGMFASDEKLIIHSAHKYDTSQKHYARIMALIEGNPDLDRHIKRVSRIGGKESVELTDGTLLQFKARTISGTARGFTGDLIVLDEAMYLPEEAVDAMLPTSSAVPNPQTWITSSAGNQASGFLWRVVKRGRAQHPTMAYFEWGTPSDADVSDRQVWADANPALGANRANALSMEALEDDFDLMTPEGFAREHLGVWDEPPDESDVAVNFQRWEQATDRSSTVESVDGFGLDASPDGVFVSIGMTGLRRDGLRHVEHIERRRGFLGLVERCVQLNEKHGPVPFAVEAKGGLKDLILPLREAGLDVRLAAAEDLPTAAKGLVEDLNTGQLMHGPQPELDDAVRAAKWRSVGDGISTFGRRRSASDISPLYAVTFAHWVAVRLSYDPLESIL